MEYGEIYSSDDAVGVPAGPDRDSAPVPAGRGTVKVKGRSSIRNAEETVGITIAEEIRAEL